MRRPHRAIDEAPGGPKVAAFFDVDRTLLAGFSAVAFLRERLLSGQMPAEEALETLVGDPVVVHGAGRTDTGVHALGQVANFRVETRLEDERLLFALNAHLPETIVVRQAVDAEDDFHAIRDAVGKRYRYQLQIGSAL